MIICKSILISTALFICVLAPKAFPQESALANTNGSTDDLRQSRKLLYQGVCAFKNKDYVLAQKDFEQSLQLDQASKFLPLFVARARYWQYQPNDRSTANVAKGREVIVAYERVLAADPGDTESASAIAEIYQEIAPEHLTELAANETIAKSIRQRIYSGLAGRANTCVNDITEGNRALVKIAGQLTYVYHMPQKRSDLEKGRACAMEGTKAIEKALILAPDDETAWSFKTSLLFQMAHIAEMEQHADEKAAYGKQAEEAKSVFRKINYEATERQRKADEDAQEIKLRRKTVDEEYSEFLKFQTTGRLIIEPQLDGSEVESGLYRLIGPMSFADVSIKDKPPIPVDLPWKTFIANQGEFSALLPSPVESAGSASYTVKSEGIRYLISSTNTSQFSALTRDAMLVTEVFESTGSVCILSSSLNATCELSLDRKLTLNTYPGVQYNVEKTQCEGVFKGLIRVYATKERLYSIIVTGADENDPRVAKFLSSIVLK